MASRVRCRVVPDAPPTASARRQLQTAYAIDPTLTSGATIAVVDAFGYPTLEADLAVYRMTFGLPACTSASGCLTIINQNGLTSPLPAENMTDNGQGWEAEAALDLDMASAACPNCKLIAVESSDDSDNGLDLGNDAATTVGATVISNSWGAPESEFSLDQHDRPALQPPRHRDLRVDRRQRPRGLGRRRLPRDLGPRHRGRRDVADE